MNRKPVEFSESEKRTVDEIHDYLNERHGRYMRKGEAVAHALRQWQQAQEEDEA